MRQLQTSTLSNQSLVAYLLAATYVADDTRAIMVSVLVDQILGGGDYSCYITRQLAGAGTAFVVGPLTTSAVAAAQTNTAFTSILIPVDNTDVVKVYVKGLAGDTTTPDIITRVYELTYLRPTTAGNKLDVSATGEAGLDFDNVKAATAPTTLTNITIPTVTTAGALGAQAKLDVNAEADTALTDYDGPTNAELATALGTADDAVLAAVATQAANLITLVQSIARSDVAEDSDIGGTFDSATDSLQALRDFISSGDGSVVSTTTTRGDVTLIAGDDYNNTDGRAISWSVTNPGSISLSGATITFVADQAVNTAGVVTDFSDASITVTTATGSTLAFYLELTAVETATLMPGHYRYRGQAALATNARVITLATGVLTVTADYD